MKKSLLLAFVLSVSAAVAQTALVVSAARSGRPGASATFDVSLTQPATVTALQWTVNLPAGYTATVALGPAATAGMKLVACTPDNTSVCILYGLNTTAIGAGTLVTYTVKLPATAAAGLVSIPVAIVMGADGTGSAVTVAGATAGVIVLDKRDLNGDGKVDGTDLQLIINEILGGPTACKDDQTGDGKCDLLDAMAVLLKILNP